MPLFDLARDRPDEADELTRYCRRDLAPRQLRGLLETREVTNLYRYECGRGLSYAAQCLQREHHLAQEQFLDSLLRSTQITPTRFARSYQVTQRLVRRLGYPNRREFTGSQKSRKLLGVLPDRSSPYRRFSVESATAPPPCTRCRAR